MMTFSNNCINLKFNYYDVFLPVKDLPKFQAGYDTSGPKRTKVSASGNYTNSDSQKGRYLQFELSYE